METPSDDRDLSNIQVETPNQGNENLTNLNTAVLESLGRDETRLQLVKPSQISNEIQAWTEQRYNDRIIKMREEIENKFEAILKEIRTSKHASTIANPRSETNGNQNSQPSGSKNDRSNGVHASNGEISKTEDKGDHPLRASDMRELTNPARPLYENAPNLDETIISEEDSEQEDYYKNYFLFSLDYKGCEPNIFF